MCGTWSIELKSIHFSLFSLGGKPSSLTVNTSRESESDLDYVNAYLRRGGLKSLSSGSLLETEEPVGAAGGSKGLNQSSGLSGRYL